MEAAETENEKHQNINRQHGIRHEPRQANTNNQETSHNVANKQGLPMVPAIDVNPSDRADDKNRNDGEGQQDGQVHRRTLRLLGNQTNQGHLVQPISKLRNQLRPPKPDEIAVFVVSDKIDHVAVLTRNIITRRY